MKAFIEPITRDNVRPIMTRAFRHAQNAVQEGSYEVVIRRKIKSRDQEEHYHAQIGDIAEQYEHFGRKWDAEDMKRLMVDAFKHDTKDDPDLIDCWRSMGDMRLVPAIGRDGFVALGEQTKKFPVKLASAFIDWLYAFGADHKVRWSDPKLQQWQQMDRAA